MNLYVSDLQLDAIQKCEVRINALRNKRPKGLPGLSYQSSEVRKEFNNLLRYVLNGLPNFNARMDPQSYSLPNYSNSEIVVDLAKSLHSFLFLGVNSIIVVRATDKKVVKTLQVPSIRGKSYVNIT